VRAVLERWLDAGREATSVLTKAVADLREAALPGRDELLRRALRRSDYVAIVAVQTIAMREDPAFVDDLGSALRADWVDPGSRTAARTEAARALGAIPTEASAAYLLQGLTATEPEVWKACQESLARIRQYHEEVRLWNEARLDRPTRESALVRLYELASGEDPVQRAEAARGLATLGAVEALPRLIEMLADPAPAVRAAAEEALERLHRGVPVEETDEAEPAETREPIPPRGPAPDEQVDTPEPGEVPEPEEPR
jgi:HEAT repeat protein